MEKEKKSILIVDDDKVILESLRTILEAEGYHVDIAETGRKAIEQSKACFYHLAVLNILLPDMKGTELLINLQETFPEMIKIMLSGLSLEKVEEFLKLSATTLIVKPIDPSKLLRIIREKLKEQEEFTSYT